MRKRMSLLAPALAVALAAGGLAVAPLGSAAAQPVTADLAAANSNTLWYDEPATSWNTQALPIGNGALGGMVFGGVLSEQLQFNEKSLWTGGPGVAGYTGGNWASPRPGALQEVINTIETNGAADPGWVQSKLGQAKTGFGAYQTFGDLKLDMAGQSSTYSGYRRDLNIGDATAKVSYTNNGVAHDREYFASYPAKAIVGRLGANQAGKVSFTLSYTSPRTGFTATASGDRLTIRGTLADNGLIYESQIRVIPSGGTLTAANGKLTVTGADSAVFVLAAGTNYADTYPTYRGTDPTATVTANVNAAAAKTYATLRSEHVADHQALFNRVSLDLGAMPNKTTDDLRAAYTGGASTDDRALEALFFQYGRYMLIASSRTGSLPANLQGVWNNLTAPEWNSDYHTDINIEMNYWLAGQTNLAETAEPYNRFLEKLLEPGGVTAESMFGSADGWVVHNEINPYGFTGVHSWVPAFWFSAANAWLASTAYDIYRFTEDPAVLNRIYPVMKGAAQFWLANLRTDPRDGKLVVTPTLSPEHGNFTAGDAMSQQLVWGLFTDTIAASTRLGTDAAFRSQLQTALTNLDPGLRVGSWGQMQEWKADLDDPANTHRHLSHLYALHPGHQVTAGTTYGNAVKKVLDAPRGAGDLGWSTAWKINLQARLLDGDSAHRMLSTQLKTATLSNLFDNYAGIFQVDGNLGATAGMTEMLLQSQNGEVHVLPAKPAAWVTGSVTGLKARGNITVDASWAPGSMDFTVRPTTSGSLTLRNRVFTGTHTLTDTTTGQPVTGIVTGDRISFTAVAGHAYRVTGSYRDPVNLALNAAATQSTTHSTAAANLAVDGFSNGNYFMGSTTHTLNGASDANPWWQVDLGSSQELGTVKLWNRADCCADRLRQFHVFVSDTPFTSNDPAVTAAQSGVWSSYQSAAIGTSLSLPVGRAGRYVRVQLVGSDRPLSLAEVQVFGNLAKNAPATQSTNPYGAAATRAVDGNTNGSYFSGSVTHTGWGAADPNPWWQVDLVSPQQVNRVKLWNRTDCCADRLKQFYVFVSDTPFTSNDPQVTAAQSGVWSSYQSAAVGTSLSIPVGRSGRYVRVQLVGSDRPLSLAEVQVL